MLLVLVLALVAAAGMAGAWYGRLQERAWWTRRLLERGLNPNTLYPRSTEVPPGPPEPLTPDADAMREAMEDMQREVAQLAEGQRFLTQLLAERRALPPERPSAPAPTGRPDGPDSPGGPAGPGDERGSPADRRR